MGNICQHSRIVYILRVFLYFLVRFCLFPPLMCFYCVLKRVFVVVYCVWYVLCCCLRGVIKHDDDNARHVNHYLRGEVVVVNHVALRGT